VFALLRRVGRCGGEYPLVDWLFRFVSVIARSAKWLQPGALFTAWNLDRHPRMLHDALAEADLDRGSVA